MQKSNKSLKQIPGGSKSLKSMASPRTPREKDENKCRAKSPIAADKKVEEGKGIPQYYLDRAHIMNETNMYMWRCLPRVIKNSKAPQDTKPPSGGRYDNLELESKPACCDRKRDFVCDVIDKDRAGMRREIRQKIKSLEMRSDMVCEKRGHVTVCKKLAQDDCLGQGKQGPAVSLKSGRFARTVRPGKVLRPLGTGRSRASRSRPRSKRQRQYHNVMWDRRVARGVNIPPTPRIRLIQKIPVIHKEVIPERRILIKKGYKTKDFPPPLTSWKRPKTPKPKKQFSARCKRQDQLRGILRINNRDRYARRLTPPVKKGMKHGAMQTEKFVYEIPDDRLIHHKNTQTSPMHDFPIMHEPKSMEGAPEREDKATQLEFGTLLYMDSSYGSIATSIVDSSMAQAQLELMEELELASLKLQQEVHDGIMQQTTLIKFRLKQRKKKCLEEKLRQAVESISSEEKLFNIWKNTPSTEVGASIRFLYGGNLTELLKIHFCQEWLNPLVEDEIYTSKDCCALLDECIEEAEAFRRVELDRQLVTERMGFDPWKALLDSSSDGDMKYFFDSDQGGDDDALFEGQFYVNKPWSPGVEFQDETDPNLSDASETNPPLYREYYSKQKIGTPPTTPRTLPKLRDEVESKKPEK